METKSAIHGLQNFCGEIQSGCLILRWRECGQELAVLGGRSEGQEISDFGGGNGGEGLQI